MLNTKIAPWPYYTEEEIKAVEEVLRSGRVNQWTGTKVKEFEGKFANYIGVNHAIAVANGTVALDIILHVIQHRIKGKEIIVTPRTFVASASAIAMAGAIPVFVDVDPDTQNITPDTIKAAITPNTEAIICVHLAGMPCDMKPIMDIAERHGIFVIEDCAQAHGASYNGKKVGSLGHAAAWSFCQDKIMSTGGEGGMITTDNPDLYQKMWAFKDHGKDQTTMEMYGDKNCFRYVHRSVGSNYRMTEMQAAIGLVQLERLDSDVKIRNVIANLYDGLLYQFSGIRVPELMEVDFSFTHAKYKHYAFVNKGGLKEGWTRDRIVEELNKEGVPCYVGSCPEVYREYAFGHRPVADFLPTARKLGETSLMFLVHPNITMDNVMDMLSGIEKVLTEACKARYV